MRRGEQEIRNYFLALDFLERTARARTSFSKELILEVQALVEKGASKEKIGLRGPMPPGVLFAVYDAASGRPDYIPPEASEVPGLLEELVSYVNTTDDHPILVAAIAHYQLVTIHPFEDGNGRTARLLSGYLLERAGYGFNGIGSLDEYFAYDPDEYYRSLQMGLPALYYSGRDNPPHADIWLTYFLRMMELYSNKVCEVSEGVRTQAMSVGRSHLRPRERAFLQDLIQNRIETFTPAEMCGRQNVSNRTIINWCAKLVAQGFLEPLLVRERIRSYRLTPLALAEMDR